MAFSDFIAKRLEEKKADYTKYSFSRVESNALKTYFDLAQEFENIEDVYQVSVAVPKSFFNLDARLFIVTSDSGVPVLVATTEDGPAKLGARLSENIRPASHAYKQNDSMVLTIRGNKELMKQFPFKTTQNVLGILEVYPYDGHDLHKELFFEKYANRVGFTVHIRFLLQKNIEHVRFIKGLVADIEHNVIVPNMVYKLFLRRLGGKIKKNLEIEQGLKAFAASADLQCNRGVSSLLAELTEVNQGLLEEFDNIEQHYQNFSLFLETLLRKSHFDEGRLTLKTTSCDMRKAVIRPQLERFMDRLVEKGIAIEDQFEGLSEDETIAVVDVGLMAQVYGNLFSNALKYTKAVTTESGEKRMAISFGMQRLKDFFGPGKNGIKYHFFSTGPHIPEEESDKVFGEGYRGSNVSHEPGTGHGLAFIKNAVEIHGGVAGYETKAAGNDFYFVLPE